MKKLILIASCAASISAYALPTYEPFTEFSATIASSGTNMFIQDKNGNSLGTNAIGSIANCLDLCTGGYSAPSGEVWGNLNFSGTAGTNIRGLDVALINNSNIFPASSLANLLPSTFPGFPTGGGITTLVENPGQPGIWNGTAYARSANVIGNSAVLKFASDITRPTNGVKTLYVSYLFSVAQQGALGGGNDGRYMAFLASSNLVEGLGSGGVYTNWTGMFNTYGSASNVAPTTTRFIGHGIIQQTANASFYMGACDTAAGKEFVTTSFTNGFGAPAFVVGAYTFNSSGADTNAIWVNPQTTSFGGATPPASPIYRYAMPFNISDIGGLSLEELIGSGGTGGIGTNYVANLIIGSTWSYVTGGPEFTTQPIAATVLGPGSSLNLTGVAVAAAQTVTYQWQHNGVNVNNGANGTGGLATVSGATNSVLSLTGLSSGDSGTYQLIATASGTGYVLGSSSSVITVSDPGVLVQPVPATANAGGTASFTATVVTTTAQLTYAWYNGSAMLVNGTQADGSLATGAQGTNSGGTVALTLTLSNVSCLDNGSYSLVVTNTANNTATTTPATLTVNDPFISVQPPATAEIAAGVSATIPVTVLGTGLTYQWNWNNANGGNVNNGEILGTSSSALTITSANTANDAGTYSVTVNGSCGPTTNSSSTIVYYDTAASSVTLSPPSLVQQVGTHLALVGTVTGGSGLVHLILQVNGTNLASGTQPDGSIIRGSGQILTGPGIGSIVLSNLQVADSGTYTLLASNAAGEVVSGSSVVKVVPAGYLTLSSNNLVVIRVGDGAQPLSGATGNTMYLDQFTTAGAYSNTIMVPDSGPGAVVVAGANISSTVAEGAQEAYLTLSSNKNFLNFGGFCFSYPFNGSDVTIGQQIAGGSTADIRGIYALDAAGTMELVYTNYGLYSGGHGFRSVFSTDGLTNFWTTGSAGAGTVKYVNAGPAGASYTITTPGQGIPALSAANSGGVVLGLCGTNLTFSDNETDGDSSLTNIWGLNEFSGAPMASDTLVTATTQILGGGEAHPCDFAFSPDLLTVYVADDDYSTSYSGSTYGGIQRYDYGFDPYTGQVDYAFSYVLSDTTGTGTNGMRGLAVYWPTNITSWGAGVEGAVLYATTTEAAGNRIIQITDNSGQYSASTVLETAAPNTFFRGIRFGPIKPPLAVTVASSAPAVQASQSVEFAANVSGVYSYYFPNAAGTGYNLINPNPTTYQWYHNGSAISGVTNFTYVLTNAQSSNSGTYSFSVTSGSPQATVSNSVTLTVNPLNEAGDLVGWWKLSDGSGTTALDSSTYGDNGALANFADAGNSEWVSGLGGADALNFDNIDTNGDNTVVVPDAPQLNFSNNATFTVAAWINSSTVQAHSAALVSKGFGNGGEQYNLDIYASGLRFFVRSPSAAVTAISSTNLPAQGVWTHVAATSDGVGNLALYVDGNLIGTASGGPSSLLPTALPLTIGNRTASSTNTYDLPFVGLMQDVRLYDVALNQQAIATLYSQLAPPSTPPSFATNTPGVFVAPGQFQLTLSGSAGASYRLWTTANSNAFTSPLVSPTGTSTLTSVTNWTLVTSGTFGGSGTAVVTDVHATNKAQIYMMTQP